MREASLGNGAARPDARRVCRRGPGQCLKYRFAAEQARSEFSSAQPGFVKLHGALNIPGPNRAERKLQIVVEEKIGPGDAALLRGARRNAQVERQVAVALGAHSGRNQGHETRRLAVAQHTEGFLQGAADARLRRYHRALGRSEIVDGHGHSPDLETAESPVRGGDEHISAGEKQIRIDIVDRRPTRQIFQHTATDMRAHLETALAVAERKISQRAVVQHMSVRDATRKHRVRDPGTQTIRQDERDVLRNVTAITVAKIETRLDHRRECLVFGQAQFETTARTAIACVEYDVLRLHIPVLGILPPLNAARQTLQGQRFLEQAR